MSRGIVSVSSPKSSSTSSTTSSTSTSSPSSVAAGRPPPISTSPSSVVSLPLLTPTPPAIANNIYYIEVKDKLQKKIEKITELNNNDLRKLSRDLIIDFNLIDIFDKIDDVDIYNDEKTNNYESIMMDEVKSGEHILSTPWLLDDNNREEFLTFLEGKDIIGDIKNKTLKKPDGTDITKDYEKVEVLLKDYIIQYLEDKNTYNLYNVYDNIDDYDNDDDPCYLVINVAGTGYEDIRLKYKENKKEYLTLIDTKAKKGKSGNSNYISKSVFLDKYYQPIFYFSLDYSATVEVKQKLQYRAFYPFWINYEMKDFIKTNIRKDDGSAYVDDDFSDIVPLVDYRNLKKKQKDITKDKAKELYKLWLDYTINGKKPNTKIMERRWTYALSNQLDYNIETSSLYQPSNKQIMGSWIMLERSYKNTTPSLVEYGKSIKKYYIFCLLIDKVFTKMEEDLINKTVNEEYDFVFITVNKSSRKPVQGPMNVEDWMRDGTRRRIHKTPKQPVRRKHSTITP